MLLNEHTVGSVHNTNGESSDNTPQESIGASDSSEEQIDYSEKSEYSEGISDRSLYEADILKTLLIGNIEISYYETDIDIVDIPLTIDEQYIVNAICDYLNNKDLDYWKSQIGGYYVDNIFYSNCTDVLAKITPYQIYAVMACESGFNKYAHSKTNDYGIMQINQICLKDLYNKFDITDMYDFNENVFSGAYYLCRSMHLKEVSGDIRKALQCNAYGYYGAKQRWLKVKKLSKAVEANIDKKMNLIDLYKES